MLHYCTIVYNEENRKHILSVKQLMNSKGLYIVNLFSLLMCTSFNLICYKECLKDAMQKILKTVEEQTSKTKLTKKFEIIYEYF